MLDQWFLTFLGIRHPLKKAPSFHLLFYYGKIIEQYCKAFCGTLKGTLWHTRVYIG